jgi:hypothetical protein
VQGPADLAERYGREVAQAPEAAPVVTPVENEKPPYLSALTTDLQPLGDALWLAHEAGDLPAMRAALSRISERMPEFLESPALEEALTAEFLTALTTDES